MKGECTAMAQAKVKYVSDSIQMQRQSFDAGTFYVAEDGGFSFDHPNGTRYNLNNSPITVYQGDFNDFKVTGTYIIEATNLTNTPIATLGLLEVFAGFSRIYQRYTAATTGAIYFRSYNTSTNTWGSWVNK